MSSSYLSLTNLQRSYEAYAETFKDHHNKPDILYKLCGNDFVCDLCGLIDLLWPLVVLMLKAQQEWCPGWKFVTYVKRVKAQLKRFEKEVAKPKPEKSIWPLLHKHAKDIEQFKYGRTVLVRGWILQDKNDRPKDDGDDDDDDDVCDDDDDGGGGRGRYKRIAREPEDFRKDLKSLAAGMINELQ